MPFRHKNAESRYNPVSHAYRGVFVSSDDQTEQGGESLYWTAYLLFLGIYFFVFQPIAAVYFALNFTFSAQPVTYEFAVAYNMHFRVAALIVCLSLLQLVVIRCHLWLSGARVRPGHIALAAFFLFTLLACLPAALLLFMAAKGEFPVQVGCPLRVEDITLFAVDNLASGIASTFMQTFGITFSQCTLRTSPFIATLAYTIKTISWIGVAWLLLELAGAARRLYLKSRAAARASSGLNNKRNLDLPSLVLPTGKIKLT